jgi:hypothetical protein
MHALDLRIYHFRKTPMKKTDHRIEYGDDDLRRSRVYGVALTCCAAPGKRNQLSKKLRSFLLLDGCFSFRSAFASI